MTTSTMLSEEDIPGASLSGRNPSTLKTDELRFWLKCRRDPAKGLKTKAQLVKRVQEYIDSGRDKNVIDPDPQHIYTKRREILNSVQDGLQQANDPVNYPSTGWSSSLRRMPLFTKAEMNIHVAQSGKKLGSTDKNHSVPTSLRKAKTFMEDEYFKETSATSDDRYFYFKTLCHHSFRKNDPPHKLYIALFILTGAVRHATCSCVAGKTGFCNHVLGLMVKLCKFSMYDCKDISELDKEEDMAPKVACTSTLQLWHRKGRGEKIKAQPVMEVVVKKTKLDVTDSTVGLKCLLYEARKKCKSQVPAELRLKEELEKINPKMGFCQVVSPGSSNYQNTRFGKSPCGSYASYHLSFTESNFKVYCNIDAVPRLDCNETLDIIVPDTYPTFPLKVTNDFTMAQIENLDAKQKALLNHIMVDEQKINSIERKTQEQAASKEWQDERKFRLTSSNFKTIVNRQRNHDTFIKNLLNPKQFSSKYTEHGKKYEPVALQQYEKYMFSSRRKVSVHKSGLVVCKDLPFLAASPDAKVIDKGCEKPFGIAEVKCPQTKFHVTPLEACTDQGFFFRKSPRHSKAQKESPLLLSGSRTACSHKS